MNKPFKSIGEAYGTVKKEPLLTEVVTSYNAPGVVSATRDPSPGMLQELLKIQKLLLDDPTQARKAVDALINKLKGSASEVSASNTSTIPSPKDYFK